jgi:hypothetical protein
MAAARLIVVAKASRRETLGGIVLGVVTASLIGAGLLRLGTTVGSVEYEPGGGEGLPEGYTLPPFTAAPSGAWSQGEAVGYGLLGAGTLVAIAALAAFLLWHRRRP